MAPALRQAIIACVVLAAAAAAPARADRLGDLNTQLAQLNQEQARLERELADLRRQQSDAQRDDDRLIQRKDRIESDFAALEAWRPSTHPSMGCQAPATQRDWARCNDLVTRFNQELERLTADRSRHNAEANAFNQARQQRAEQINRGNERLAQVRKRTTELQSSIQAETARVNLEQRMRAAGLPVPPAGCGSDISGLGGGASAPRDCPPRMSAADVQRHADVARAFIATPPSAGAAIDPNVMLQAMSALLQAAADYGAQGNAAQQRDALEQVETIRTAIEKNHRNATDRHAERLWNEAAALVNDRATCEDIAIASGKLMALADLAREREPRAVAPLTQRAQQLMTAALQAQREGRCGNAGGAMANAAGAPPVRDGSGASASLGGARNDAGASTAIGGQSAPSNYTPDPPPEQLIRAAREKCRGQPAVLLEDCMVTAKVNLLLAKNGAIRAACAGKQGAALIACVDHAYVFGPEPPGVNDLRERLAAAIDKRWKQVQAAMEAAAQPVSPTGVAPAGPGTSPRLVNGRCPSGFVTRAVGFGGTRCVRAGQNPDQDPSAGAGAGSGPSALRSADADDASTIATGSDNATSGGNRAANGSAVRAAGGDAVSTGSTTAVTEATASADGAAGDRTQAAGAGLAAQMPAFEELEAAQRAQIAARRAAANGDKPSDDAAAAVAALGAIAAAAGAQAPVDAPVVSDIALRAVAAASTIPTAPNSIDDRVACQQIAYDYVLSAVTHVVPDVPEMCRDVVQAAQTNMMFYATARIDPTPGPQQDEDLRTAYGKMFNDSTGTRNSGVLDGRPILGLENDVRKAEARAAEEAAARERAEEQRALEELERQRMLPK